MRKSICLVVLVAAICSTHMPAAAAPVPLGDFPQVQTTSTATTTDRLNLRTGPALSFGVIQVLPLGASVTLTGGDENGFREVTYNSREGWAFGAFLSIDAPVPSPNDTATTTDRLNLRSGSGITFPVMTVLPVGAIVTLTGQSENGFRSVTWGGFNGWVSSTYLDFGEEPPPPPDPVPDTNAMTTANLNLRSGAGTSFAAILVMPMGSRVVLTGQESNGFLSLSFNGQNGWASDDFLVIDGAAPAPIDKATTTARLNMRSAPNTSSTVLSVIPDRGVVNLTGQSSNGFRSVSYNGVNGWVFEAFLDLGATEPPPPPPPPVGDAPFDVTNTIIGPTRGSAAEALAFALSAGAVRIDHVELFINEMYRLAPEIGFDPALLVAQSALETSFWRSSWWVERLNPAGLGVTGDPAQNAASPTFASGTIAARAQIAHMHAEVIGNAQPLPEILQGVDPTYQRVFEAGWAGTIVTLEDLAGTWAVDPLYDTKIVSRAREIFGP